MKALLLSLLLLTAGCSTWDTMPAYEKAWHTMNVIDAGQTIHIAREPSCYREVGFPTRSLIGEHPSESQVYLTMAAYSLIYHGVSRWLDRKVEESFTLESDSRGPWAVARGAWHGGMLLAKGATILNNADIELRPWGRGCP